MNLIAMISMFKNIFNGYFNHFDQDLRLFMVPDDRQRLLEIKYDGSPASSIVGDNFPFGMDSLPVAGRIVQDESVCLFHGDRFKLELEDGSCERLFLAVDEHRQDLNLFRWSDRESIITPDLHPSDKSLYPWMRDYRRLFESMIVKFNGYSFRVVDIKPIANQLICGTFVEAQVIHNDKLIDSRNVLIPAAWVEFTGLYMRAAKSDFIKDKDAIEWYDVVYNLCRAKSLKYGTSIDLIDWEDDNFEE